MSYSIEILTTEKAVQITVNGTLTMDLRQRVLEEAAAALKKHSLCWLYIDVSNTQFEPDEMMTRAISLVNYMSELDFPDNCRIAFFYLDAEEYRKFFECAAQTAGFNLCYFGSREAAFEWLRKG